MTYRDFWDEYEERKYTVEEDAEAQKARHAKRDWKRCRICKKLLLPADTLNNTCCDDCHLQERKDQAP